MNSIQECILEVLGNPSFYDENRNVDNPDDLVAAIKKMVPEASVEQIDEVLMTVSKQLQTEDDELFEADLNNVAGGFAVTITVAGVCAVIKGAVAVGAAAGTIYWYYKHRNC